MKSRNKENDPFNNLDSFLDTLFNVAGILIIFLIMSLLLKAAQLLPMMINLLMILDL